MLKKFINLTAFLSLGFIFQACDLEDLPLYRVKLKIHTASKNHAGTNDPVYVKLKSSAGKYYMDYGRNDFERNYAHNYDLVISGMTELRDIQQLQIGKEGNDGLCIEKVELFINNNELMFSKNFGNSNCHWLDNDNGHTRTITFDYDDLRSGGNWSVDLEDLNYPSTFTAETMESMVESIVGDQLQKTDFSDIASGLEVKWGYKRGSEYVSIARKNDSTQRVDLDLKLIYNYTFLGMARTAKFELDLDMDFKYACESNALKMKVQNISTDASIRQGSLLVRILWFFVPKSRITGMISDAINESGMMDDMSQDFGECPLDFKVDSSGNLDLEWPPFDLMDFI